MVVLFISEGEPGGFLVWNFIRNGRVMYGSVSGL